jgi:hypothetical protein
MRLLLSTLGLAALALTACGAPAASTTGAELKAPEATPCAAPNAAARDQVPESQRGFEPIDDDAVPSFVGKTVYAGSIVKVSGGRRAIGIISGEALTLCRADTKKEPPPRKLGRGEVVRTRDFGGPPPPPGPKHSLVVVKNADGEMGEVQLTALSAQPLKYDLRHPGDGKTLLMAAFHEASALAPKIDALHAQHAFQLASISANEPDAAKRRDSRKVRAMRESFEASKHLVHNLVYGSNMAKESLLREKMWAVKFGDPTLVEVYAHGIKDPEEKKKHEALQRCLGSLSGATAAGNEARRAEASKAEKAWRKNMKGVPDAQLAALDAENEAKLDAEIARLKQRREEQLAAPTCKDQ